MVLEKNARLWYDIFGLIVAYGKPDHTRKNEGIMVYSNNNGTLTVFFEGRIDTSNADKVGAELDNIFAEQEYENFVLDVNALEYISSAGLRVVLRARKANPNMKIVGASTDVYDIFDMTGFTEMIPIEKAYRQFSVDGCKIIGQGAKGTVYRYNEDTIIKVYKSVDSLPDIKNERELARRAFVLGIPTALSYDVVKVGDKYGSVFELLEAKSYSQLIAEDPGNIEKYVRDYALLLKKIHSTEVKADDMPDIKTFIYQWVDMDEPELDPGDAAKLRKLIADVPDTLNMLHCDYHTNNVMCQKGETLLIDMDTLSHGHPVFELANIYITYVGFGEVDPSNVEKFIGLDYIVAKKIWEIFLPVYLGTDDKARLQDVELKARLLSYVRLMRHTLRRRGTDADADAKAIEYCRKNIHELLGQLDTLDF